MSTAKLISESLAPLVDAVYPPRCPICGDGLAAQNGLCAGCWGELAIPGVPACSACQRPFAADAASGLTCAPCQQARPRHDGIAAGTLYNDTARRLVLNFKHGRKIALAPMLAGLIAARLPPMDESWLAIPVPLHRTRLWKRGYNQSALLATELAKRTPANLLVDGLLRTRATPSLGGLGKRQRARTLEGAIKVNPARADAIRGAPVLLVDDVLTSGATSDACVKALKQSGASRVVIGCFSRVLDEAL
ncbi:ComF family protein [Aurantiacibacter aquimixticola]|uniref:ComF family protein n=1 Tax=Aurantiacibacter aquimixticola TaxID=1958945 RepID=A0A419RRW7_9SPHN|nr:ComF family protein [Aurantiacibacter aquimixticola]RJY08504.1 ComF family protein [Aurantiacibacter aquimixticola]